MLQSAEISMPKLRSPTDRLLVGGQMLLIAIALVMGLAPPAEGVMLIAPLHPSTPGETLGWVNNVGARLVARGPYEGALFVFGERAPLARAALWHGAIILRASGVGCATVSKDAI